jgi:hypothetical protein
MGHHQMFTENVYQRRFKYDVTISSLPRYEISDFPTLYNVVIVLNYTLLYVVKGDTYLETF